MVLEQFDRVKACPDALEIRLGQLDTQLESLAEAQARPANRVGASDGRELEWRYWGPLGFRRIRVLSVVELPTWLDYLEGQGLVLDPADRDRLDVPSGRGLDVAGRFGGVGGGRCRRVLRQGLTCGNTLGVLTFGGDFGQGPAVG